MAETKVSVLLWLPAVLLLPGCDEVELNVGSAAPQRSVRPAPEPIRGGRAASAPSAAASARPAPLVREPPDATIEPIYYQLVLTSDAVPAEAPPGIVYLHLRCGSPRAVGAALAALYLASGGSG